MVNTKNIATYNNCCRWFLIKVISLLLILFVSSCNCDDIIKEEVESTLDIKIDNEQLKITNNQISSNESCDDLFASCSYQNPNNPGFRIEFRLKKNGALRNITLFDYRNQNAHFESADFNPKGLMLISNFTYDAAKKYLHFDFKGYLLKQAYYEELDIVKEKKYIEGSVDINTVRNTECTFTNPQLNFATTDFNFFSTIYFGEYNPTLVINPYQLYFYSDNGFRTIIKSKIKFPQVALGTYNFDQNTVENKIDFDQYVGVFRATQLLYVRDIDWKKYKTAGSYTILEQRTLNGEKVTKGEMNLQVYDNGVIQHDIKNAKFEVAEF